MHYSIEELAEIANFAKIVNISSYIDYLFGW